MKDLLAAGAGQKMVEGGGQIEQDQGTPVDRRTDDMPDVAVMYGKNEENHQPDDGQAGTYSMGDAMGEFFPKCVRGFLWGAGHGE